MQKGLLMVAIVAMYLLHQDVWFWRATRPVVFGILPIGLFYHAVYAAAVVPLMFLLVKYAWPESDAAR